MNAKTDREAVGERLVPLDRFIMAGLDTEAALAALGPEYANLREQVREANNLILKIVLGRDT